MMLVSERRVCRMLGQHRSTQRKVPCGADDEAALIEDIIELAKQYGRYGYRRVTALLHAAGWTVNYKRVERIWRREGLKVPQRQPKRGRLWFNDAGCARNMQAMSGLAVSSRGAPTMVGNSASSPSSTNSARSAWPSSSLINSAMRMCWRPWRSCSFGAVRLLISGPITAANSSLARSGNGSARSA